jgi:hypothetical protein
MMTTLVAQIAPQRSTQYSAVADALAPHELTLSSLGSRISGIAPIELGGQSFLRFDYNGSMDAPECNELGMLAMTSAYYEYRELIADMPGPWLRPIDTGYAPVFPPDLIMTRRYKGKTNELFTQFMCNIARHSSAFAAAPWRSLRVFDPLAGGGTTLFAALLLGANVVGVEKDSGDGDVVGFHALPARRHDRAGAGLVANDRAGRPALQSTGASSGSRHQTARHTGGAQSDERGQRDVGIALMGTTRAARPTTVALLHQHRK